MTADYEELKVITALMQDRALSSYRKILEEEVGLRQELDEMEQLRVSALHRDAGDVVRQITGADALWQGWLAKRRAGLTQDLVMLQIRKNDHRDLAQTAFARNQVAEDLARDEARKRNLRRAAQLDLRLQQACTDFQG